MGNNLTPYSIAIAEDNVYFLTPLFIFIRKDRIYDGKLLSTIEESVDPYDYLSSICGKKHV